MQPATVAAYCHSDGAKTLGSGWVRRLLGSARMTTLDVSRRRRVIAVVAAGTLVVAGAGVLLAWRSARAVNRSTLASVPRPVTFVEAKASSFRGSRTYVGSIEPWVEANVGPQYVSAYAQTVLVRPGDSVKRGAVLATLDCASPNAATRVAEMQAQAVDERQRAMSDEAARVRSLLDGGFAAVNDSEQREAHARSEQAQLSAARERMNEVALDVRDCVLRAPFDGEIATRTIDPGAFVRPGTAIVSVVDRATVRVSADAPEKDFDVIPPGNAATIEVLSTGARVVAPISRRAPKADPTTRTVHFEIDVSDAARAIPVSTTGLVHVDYGAPRPATELPVDAASVLQHKAKLFVLEGDVARAKEVCVVGEAGGSLFVDPAELAPGTRVIVFGRALLRDGDRVAPKLDVPPPRGPEDDGSGRGAGSGRPM
jgi:membrane fusion protein, multidrug efflux system